MQKQHDVIKVKAGVCEEACEELYGGILDDFDWAAFITSLLKMFGICSFANPADAMRSPSKVQERRIRRVIADIPGASKYSEEIFQVLRDVGHETTDDEAKAMLASVK